MKKIAIAYNDDGSDSANVDGTIVEFGDIGENVEAVRTSLESKGFSTSLLPLRRDILDDFISGIKKSDFDIVFNLCEGAFGLSSLEPSVAGLYELYGTKYTGNSPFTLTLALNKAYSKDILRSKNIPTAAYFLAEGLDYSLPRGMSFPLIVKPVREDASIGIEVGSVVNTEGELRERVERVLRDFNQPAIIEEYVEGREFNVSVMGNGSNALVLPPSEIDFTGYPEGFPKIVSFDAKWIEASPLYLHSAPVCPARVDKELGKYLEETALGAYRTLMCRDYARVDMRLGRDGKLRVLEVNPNPDISTDAGLARAARANGWDYSEMVERIARFAWARYA